MRARISLILIGVAMLSILTACSPGDSPPAVSTVTFHGRTIDLEPFLQGYPYSGAVADVEQGKLLYFETREEGQWMRLLDLEPGVAASLAEGRKVGRTDWATRSFGDGRFMSGGGHLVVSSDEGNDERFKLYDLDLASGRLDRITDTDYLYGWAFSPDRERIAYIARTGLEEPFVSCLRVLDLESGEDRAILCDEGGDDRFTWSEILWTPDGGSVILNIQHDGDRRLCTLTRIDLGDPSFRWLQEPRQRRFGLELVEGWIDPQRFLYRMANADQVNLNLYDLRSGESRQLTHFQSELRRAFLLEGDSPRILLALRRPDESEILLLKATSGGLVAHEVIPAAVDILDAHGDRAVLTSTDLVSPQSLEWLEIADERGAASFRRAPLASMPDSTRAKVVHSRAERVSIPTFDTDESGATRRLHAFYLEPLDPPDDPSQRLVRIIGFYGGGNGYSINSQVRAAAGLATLSPAVRGSHGWGAEFASLNDGDLGGDEIVDLIRCARWLVKEKGYEPWQIGVEGGSHGGYAVMRALTFPPETNGRGESFPFGWGHSSSGMSDLIRFYEKCNIPDWVILEAGDPVAERGKLADRSPLSHVDLLRAPLLLTHGEKDWRVPVEQSRLFAEKARELGKPVTYVEFPGQGHGFQGLENARRFYQAFFDFLETVEPPE